MRFANAFLCLILWICPCALCYGQVHFSSVHGERGYSALRGSVTWDLGADVLFSPLVGYYRMSDTEQDEKGSTSRYGAQVVYDWKDWLQWIATLRWQPKAIGYQAVLYDTSLQWFPFYYWHGIKQPFVRLGIGQGRYRSLVNTEGERLPRTFREVDTSVQAEGGAQYHRWNLKAQWQKVLKYSEPVPTGISFSWAEIPYLAAVMQGFVKEATALRVSYGTSVVTPYMGLVRYRYVQSHTDAFAVLAGLNVHLWGASFLGGIEVFEPRREENRKTFFSLSVEAEL